MSQFISNNNGWISVEQEIPKHKQEVLCYDRRGWYDVHTALVDYDRGTIKFQDPLGAINDEVTHWMPLPEQPKK